MSIRSLAAIRHRARSALGRLLPQRVMRDRRGSAAIEFAAVSIPFFALIGAIIETALVFLAGQILDTAVNDAARLIRTGQVQQSKMDAAAFKTEVCKRLYILFDCSGLFIDVRTSSDFTSISTSPPIDKDGKFVKDFSYNAGKATEIVVVKAYYEFHLTLSGLGLDLSDLANGNRLLGAVTAFRNEPFPW
ncbi:TadE/TadG family type IV pilus assembly protein [Prosthecomicrobium sp. N25]|uniref:TadE/TadG family type IV pilus assembly protein n=1 Tax=Prosthecomicrobium sp. N25 TaxID=3129254 RepID=UPI00307882E5